MSGIAVGEDAVWVTADNSDELVRLNPGTGEVETRIPLGALPGDLLVHEGFVWVTVLRAS